MMEAARITALKKGRNKYRGHKCANCGHVERYTSNGGCVNCPKIKAARELERARKFRRETYQKQIYGQVVTH